MEFRQLNAFLGDLDVPVGEFSGVTADSRAVKPDDIFIALAGVKTDGARFATAAVEAGAVAVLASPDADLPPLNVPVIRFADPRLALALIAAALAGHQPEKVVAVTGTAGKTSVASFTRQIFAHAGLSAASIGTTGVVSEPLTLEGALTTPDPVQLHSLLKVLADKGVTHAAMEASSHGLDQRRLDGVELAAAAFTNLGRDHMDYHATVEEYFACKMRLFDQLLARGRPAIIYADDEWSERAIEVAKAAGLDVRSVGRKGDFIVLKRVEHERHRQIAELAYGGRVWRVELPLAGDFQIANALVSAGLAISIGVDPDVAFAALEKLEGAPGRLELVGNTNNGALVYVDYAHKPDALEQVLSSVRPFTTGKVSVVIGAGGDRDPGKRPMMGEVAGRLADRVYVTDDNPRSEDPATIRAAIMQSVPQGVEVGDRREAIRQAVAELDTGDTLVIAGKGHETGQTAAGVTKHFSDHEEARAAIAELDHSPMNAAGPLWTGQDIIDAIGARPTNGVAGDVTGVSIDTRTLEAGDVFFAIAGDNFDGHTFASKAVAAGCSALVVAEEKLPALGHITKPLMVVPDVLQAMERLGVAARARTKAKIVAVTGSAGKTTTKEALRHVFAQQSSKVHASPKSFNNHWGVPLTLARMPQDTEYAVFEIGMNHAGEITPLVKMVRPHVAMITLIAAAHLGNFKNMDGIAHAKAEIFRGVVRGGTALINRDDKRFKMLSQLAGEAGVHRVAGYGKIKKSDVVLTDVDLRADASTVSANVFGEKVTFEVPIAGRHVVQNLLGVLGAAHLLGADVEKAAASFASLQSVEGRGKLHTFKAETGPFTVIDESYNANPASVAATLQILKTMEPGTNGRRIAILGDMLELGDHARKLHAGLADDVREAELDRVILGGPEMKALAEAIGDGGPSVMHYDAADDVVTAAINLVHAGDVVLVKSSNGIGFSKVIKAFEKKYAV